MHPILLSHGPTYEMMGLSENFLLPFLVF